MAELMIIKPLYMVIVTFAIIYFKILLFKQWYIV